MEYMFSWGRTIRFSRYEPLWYLRREIIESFNSPDWPEHVIIDSRDYIAIGYF